MEASTGPLRLPLPPTPQTHPDVERVKQKLLRRGVYPTPKILRTLRKKETQKSLRKSKANNQSAQKQELAAQEAAHFQALKTEYRSFTKAIQNAKAKERTGNSALVLVGKPWEALERLGMRELSSESREYGGEKLKTEHLRELSDIIQDDRDKFRWLLDDDVQMEANWPGQQNWSPPKRRGGDSEAIRLLIDRLTGVEVNVKDWKFTKMMKQSALPFTEMQLMKIVEGLDEKKQWRNALSVVEWVYKLKEHRRYKSRFVYTKLLSVLGKASRPHEALQIFNLMRGDCDIYPDMAAYHSVAVTLGQAGFLKELLNIIDCMKQKPVRKVKHMRRKNWDPILQPDLVVYNAVLNACVPSREWKGVSWVFEQLRKGGLRPNGATYGLAMEVMLQSGKYNLVHDFFEKMKRNGEAPKAVTYKVLVKAFWEEGRANDAVQAVRDMEARGVVGTASVYYQLACCLCNNGRWQEAMLEIEKLKRIPYAKPLSFTFTGMILSSLQGGHVDDCVSIFKQSKDHCSPDIGMLNAMLKVYGCNDMFTRAKKLFEETKGVHSGSKMLVDDDGFSLIPDAYTFSAMLEVSARTLQWEYFEYVYKEMALSGYKLDQSKHTSLLVEASRAGKFHLLEHAFDTILEAGEIPHPSFFTEILCQAASQHDYEKVVSIVNSVANVPFHISEHEWIDLFKENRDRLGRVVLKGLSDALHNFDLATEASASSFSRALQIFCGASGSNDVSNLIASHEAVGQLPSDFSDRGFDGDGNTNVYNVAGSTVDPIICDEPVVNNCDEVGMLSVDHAHDGREGDAATESLNFEFIEDVDTDGLHVADDLAPTDFSNFLEDRKLNDGHLHVMNELIFDTSIDEGDDYSKSNSPSADEILETWKENRQKDGIFFPFQLGGY